MASVSQTGSVAAVARSLPGRGAARLSCGRQRCPRSL